MPPAPTPTVNILVRVLLAPPTCQLYLGLFVMFYAHLVREHRAKVWLSVASFAAHTDLVLSSGIFLSILACVCFALGFCSLRGASCGAPLCFPLVAYATLTLGWSSVVRLADAHDLKVTCASPLCRHLCDRTPATAGFFTVWLWKPTGLFQVVRRTLAQPWACIALETPQPVHNAEGPSNWWEWREFLVGSAFWLSLLLCLIVTPSAARTRSFADFRSGSLLLALWLTILGVSLASYLAFNATVEPLMYFWAFLLGSVSKLRRPVPAADGRPQPRLRTPQPLLPEEVVTLLLLLWLFARLAYVSVTWKLEQWSAREKCEERLRSALAHPFRADLEEGFASASGGEGEESLLSSTSEIGGRSISAGSLETLQEKRRTLITARRRLLRDQVGGVPALPSTLHLRIRRSHLLADTWRCMIEHPVTELLAPSLVVEFVGEGGVDAGGVARDWFDAVGKALAEDSCSPAGGLLAVAPDGTLLPRPLVPEGEPAVLLSPSAGLGDEPRMALLAAGRFMALAVLSAHPLPLSLSLIVCKYLLQCPISTEDIRRLDPDFYRWRVEALLGEGAVGRLEAALGEPLSFVSAPTERLPDPEELVPGGEMLVVSEANKTEYLPLLCEAYLCGGVRHEIQCLLQGFWDLLPLQLLQDQEVRPGELSVLIAGVQDLDPEAWRLHSITPADGGAVCRWFWELVRDELGADQRCLLLHFATGSSRLLPGGFAELQPPFSLEVSDLKGADHLPHAHTCINRLVLHRYRTRTQLKEKLMLALEADGFAFS